MPQALVSVILSVDLHRFRSYFHVTDDVCLTHHTSQVFRIITSNFADVDPGLLASLHDTPWTMIKLAHTARKQGLTEVCLNSLGKLYSVATMDVQV